MLKSNPTANHFRGNYLQIVCGGRKPKSTILPAPDVLDSAVVLIQFANAVDSF